VRNDGIRGNGDEAQFYVRDGVEVSGGKLHLKLFYDASRRSAQGARCNADELAYSTRPVGKSICQRSDERPPTGFFSGRVNTKDKVQIKYGVIETRIKLATRNSYSWSAFWMLGQRVGTVGWPFCGESEITELWTTSTAWSASKRGRPEAGVGEAMRPAITLHTYHTTPSNYYEARKNKQAWVKYNEGAYAHGTFNAHGYNTYRWVKMPGKIEWFVNGRPVAEAHSDRGQVRLRLHNGHRWGPSYGGGLWAPFEDQPFFMIFNLAFASGVSLGQGNKNIDKYRTSGELDRASMDYVEVWEYKV